MLYEVQPLGFVRNYRTEPIDDQWKTIIAEIELAGHIPKEAFDHTIGFSHLEIIFLFDKVKTEYIIFSGRPRGNPKYPRVGIFRQRKKD